MNNAQNVLSFVLIMVVFTLPSFGQNEVSRKESAQIEKLTRGADVIVTGKVTRKESGWNENKTRIYTRTTLQIDEYLKGRQKEEAVEVFYPGGEVGEVGELYSHMPRFEENEEVLVFLKKDEQLKGFKVFNGEEGKITIVKDSDTNEKVTGSNIRINALKQKIQKYIAE